MQMKMKKKKKLKIISRGGLRVDHGTISGLASEYTG